MSRARKENRDAMRGRLIQRVTLTQTISPGEKPALRVGLERISPGDAIKLLRHSADRMEAEHANAAEKISDLI